MGADDLDDLDRLESQLRELGRVAAPAAVEQRVMARLGERAFLGLPARKWGYVAACLGGWALAVQGIVGWAASSLGQ